MVATRLLWTIKRGLEDKNQAGDITQMLHASIATDKYNNNNRDNALYGNEIKKKPVILRFYYQNINSLTCMEDIFK